MGKFSYVENKPFLAYFTVIPFTEPHEMHLSTLYRKFLFDIYLKKMFLYHIHV